VFHMDALDTTALLARTCDERHDKRMAVGLGHIQELSLCNWLSRLVNIVGIYVIDVELAFIQTVMITVLPSRSRTPTARPPSISTSSTCARSCILPPFFFTPLQQHHVWELSPARASPCGRALSETRVVTGWRHAAAAAAA